MASADQSRGYSILYRNFGRPNATTEYADDRAGEVSDAPPKSLE
jgi:hypothetical protein